MLTTYKEIKEELKKLGCKTTYFTKQFYSDYLTAIKTITSDKYNASEDAYTVNNSGNNITLYHSYDAIYNSDFYNKNSPTYCQFLEVISPYRSKLEDEAIYKRMLKETNYILGY